MTSAPTSNQTPFKLDHSGASSSSTRTLTQFEQDRLQAAFLQAPALICVTRGPRHVIEAMSDLYAKAIGGGDVVGQEIARAVPDMPAQRLLILDTAFSTGEPYDGKAVLETVATEEGTEDRYFNLAVQPLKNESDVVYGLMIHAVDVTEQAKTRQELADLALALERTNRELDSFAYAASHDLRAPLRGIANLAQWIEEDLQSSTTLNSETREMLELMRLRMHRMEGLIEGLLQYSRAGRVHETPEAVDVGGLVREVIDLLSPPPEVEIVVASDLPVIRTERLLLQQVFMNLIGNAIKHSNRSDPRIEISGRRVGPFYEFAVRDNGPGISPDFHDRIWGIFQTLESRDRVEGAGIGLALVKKLVESQKGRAWVESAEGDGAVFRFLWRKQ